MNDALGRKNIEPRCLVAIDGKGGVKFAADLTLDEAKELLRAIYQNSEKRNIFEVRK